MKDFKNALTQAVENRSSLLATLQQEGTYCFRVLRFEESPGQNLELDVYGTEKGLVAFASLRHETLKTLSWVEIAQTLEEHLKPHIAPSHVLAIGGALKTETCSEPLPLLYQNQSEAFSIEFWTTERHLKFRLELTDVLNPGLFLDQRLNRARLAELVQRHPGSVLNLFSYTGSFSVVAAHAQASHQVTSVDLSRRYLTWEGKNHEANGTLERSKRIPEDAATFLQRCQRRLEAGKAQPFSWIIIDPPTFSRHERKTFSVQKELENLVTQAFVLLPHDNPSGIFFSSNDATWDEEKFTVQFSSLARKLQCQFQPGVTPSDVSLLKSAWFFKNWAP